MRPDRQARTMLPIHDRRSPGLTTYDPMDPDAAYPPIVRLLPSEGAPNVVVIMLDDVGYCPRARSTVPARRRTQRRSHLAGVPAKQLISKESGSSVPRYSPVSPGFSSTRRVW